MLVYKHRQSPMNTRHYERVIRFYRKNYADSERKEAASATGPTLRDVQVEQERIGKHATE